MSWSRRIQQLEDSGIKPSFNCNVGEDISLREIREAHDAVLIATGVYKRAKDLKAGRGL
jgi:glutamate synthase (NADPH/NADH) small chain